MKTFKSNFKGSASESISTLNQELVENGITYKNFDFYNKEACTVQINKSNNIFLSAGQGFSYQSENDSIFSFKIVTVGVTFNFIGKK